MAKANNDDDDDVDSGTVLNVALDLICLMTVLHLNVHARLLISLLSQLPAELAGSASLLFTP